MNEFQKHITQDLGCILGIFKKDDKITTFYSPSGELSDLGDVGVQLLILSIKNPRFERLLHDASDVLRTNRRDIADLVDRLDPHTEINLRRHGTENQ